MAISQVEEKILGKLAKKTEESNSLLAANLYQVLGLSILLSQKLYRAKKLRKLDTTRDTKSLQLYHQIIWLAREGLSITEVYILPYCQDGEQGPECRVMAAKLRASLYHIFCLFHNHPPVNGTRRYSSSSGSPPSANRSPKQNSGQTGRPSSKSPKGNNGTRRRRSSKSGLRDPIPSITSDASYITNPYASPMSPPPAEALPPLPPEANRTPSRPPGLKPIKIPSPQAAASFLLPPLNFVPMAREHFEGTQQLATTLLSAVHPLRLAVTLEHATFLWDCQKDPELARNLAARTIKEVYASSEAMDDEDFQDCAVIVQALGGIVKRGSNESSPKFNNSNGSRNSQASQPRNASNKNLPMIDRTIALSPPSTSTSSNNNNARRPSLEPSPFSHHRSTPDRLSTVPEDPSRETSERENDRATTTAPTTISPPMSRLSSRASGKTGTSGLTDKAAKRRVLEAAEQELYRRGSQSAGASSRQTTPVEGYVRPGERP